MTSGPEARGWFNEIAAFLGDAYWAPGTTRVQAFTVGTEQEVDFLVDALALGPGARVLDAGCGPGRHSLSLARRGIDVVGVDLSPDFIALASDTSLVEVYDPVRAQSALQRVVDAYNAEAPRREGYCWAAKRLPAPRG